MTDEIKHAVTFQSKGPVVTTDGKHAVTFQSKGPEFVNEPTLVDQHTTIADYFPPKLNPNKMKPEEQLANLIVDQHTTIADLEKQIQELKTSNGRGWKGVERLTKENERLRGIVNHAMIFGGNTDSEKLLYVLSLLRKS